MTIQLLYYTYLITSKLVMLLIIIDNNKIGKKRSNRFICYVEFRINPIIFKERKEIPYNACMQKQIIN